MFFDQAIKGILLDCFLSFNSNSTRFFIAISISTDTSDSIYQQKYPSTITIMKGTKIPLILLSILISRSDAWFAYPGVDPAKQTIDPDTGKPFPGLVTSTAKPSPSSSTSISIPTSSAISHPPRIPTQAYCTKNANTKMCAMGVGVKNPTQYYNQINQDTKIDFSFWDSKCNPIGEQANFTISRTEHLAGFYFAQGGNITLSAALPPASYEHCYDGPGLGEGDHATCESKDWAQFPCGCSQLDKANYGMICVPTLHDKCVLKPGFLEFNATTSKGKVNSYQSSLSVTTREGKNAACNCDKKYQNNCPKEYVFCCGCEFECGA